MFGGFPNALLVTVDTKLEGILVQRLDEFSLEGHTLNLQQCPPGMSNNEVFKFVGEEVRKEYKAHHQGRALATTGRPVVHVGGCDYGDERRTKYECPASQKRAIRQLKQRKEQRRVGSTPLTFKEYITKYSKGCFLCSGRNQAHENYHKMCK